MSSVTFSKGTSISSMARTITKKNFTCILCEQAETDDMETKSLAANLSSSSGKTTATKLTIRFLHPDERRKHAFKTLGLFWAISLGSIPLPPIHWVTVPGFFLYGIYAFQKKLREAELLAASSFTCPECGKTIDSPEQSLKMPIAITCPHCHFNLKLNLAD
jgi:predicted RNA-binding Zn-ribbon protein involved in translation (DUF1610 family)